MVTIRNRLKPYLWAADKPEGQPGLTVGWYFSQFSHHAWVLCSKQMLFFKISAKSYSFIVFSVQVKLKKKKKLSADTPTTDGPHTGPRQQTHLECSVQGNAWWRAMWARSGPSPCRSDTDCCSPLHSRTVFRWQTQRRNPENWIINTRQINKWLHVYVWSTYMSRSGFITRCSDIHFCWLPTCCWPPCRPGGPPAPGSPGGAGWGWSGSSFGLSDPVWPCPFARLSLPGSGPAPRPRGWSETLAGSCWPWGVEMLDVRSGNAHGLGNILKAKI